jgi:hypothetical protein
MSKRIRKNSTKKQRMYDRIRKHGIALIDFFKLPASTDPVLLCKKLFQLENKMTDSNTRLCNGYIDQAQADQDEEAVARRLKTVLKDAKRTIKIVINRDPRGYALKIEEPTAFYHRDMGGYGIIAPDLRSE